MIKTILKDAEDRMHKASEVVRQELAKIRTGKATTALLDGVKVEYYGSAMALSHVANVGVSDIHSLTVQPFDKGALDPIMKGIQAANLGLNPSNDGQVIRVPIPALTMERRKDMVKQLGKMTEEARVRARGVRREYNELFKGLFDDKDITEDDLDRLLEKVQKATDAAIKKLDDLAAAKEKEVLEV